MVGSIMGNLCEQTLLNHVTFQISNGNNKYGFHWNMWQQHNDAKFAYQAWWRVFTIFKVIALFGNTSFMTIHYCNQYTNKV
jgi:hypothetical protein